MRTDLRAPRVAATVRALPSPRRNALSRCSQRKPSPTTIPALPAALRRALSLAAVAGITTAGPAAFGTTSAHAAELSGIKYTCAVLSEDEDGDDDYEFTDPWTITINADLPATATVGQRIPSPEFTAKITMGTDAATDLQKAGVTSIDFGGSLHFYTVGTTVGAADIDFGDNITIPSSGPVTLSGTGEAESYKPTTPGPVKVTMDDVYINLISDDEPADVVCEPLPGQNLTLATITVADTHTTQPTTTTPPSASTSTTPPSASITTETETSVVTRTVSGPPVQTDQLTSRGNNTATISIAAAALLALVTITGFAARAQRR